MSQRLSLALYHTSHRRASCLSECLQPLVTFCSSLIQRLLIATPPIVSMSTHPTVICWSTADCLHECSLVCLMIPRVGVFKSFELQRVGVFTSLWSQRGVSAQSVYLCCCLLQTHDFVTGDFFYLSAQRVSYLLCRDFLQGLLVALATICAFLQQLRLQYNQCKVQHLSTQKVFYLFWLASHIRRSLFFQSPWSPDQSIKVEY